MVKTQKISPERDESGSLVDGSNLAWAKKDSETDSVRSGHTSQSPSPASSGRSTSSSILALFLSSDFLSPSHQERFDPMPGKTSKLTGHLVPKESTQTSLSEASSKTSISSFNSRQAYWDTVSAARSVTNSRQGKDPDDFPKPAGKP